MNPLTTAPKNEKSLSFAVPSTNRSTMNPRLKRHASRPRALVALAALLPLATIAGGLPGDDYGHTFGFTDWSAQVGLNYRGQTWGHHGGISTMTASSTCSSPTTLPIQNPSNSPLLSNLRQRFIVTKAERGFPIMVRLLAKRYPEIGMVRHGPTPTMMAPRTCSLREEGRPAF